MQVFLVRSSAYEPEREKNILLLQKIFGDIHLVEAVYPGYQRVPFQERIFNLAGERTGHRLNAGELGCLLSHRKIWAEIKAVATDPKEGFLILESDSLIKDIDLLTGRFPAVHDQYDLFFWGAFDNRMKLLKSTCMTVSVDYQIGVPFVKSLYCTYGYSINKKAAEFLLRDTCKVNYPCDHWKRRLIKSGLSTGGIQPCIIETDRQLESKIRDKNFFLYRIFYWAMDRIIDLKNIVISGLS